MVGSKLGQTLRSGSVPPSACVRRADNAPRAVRADRSSIFTIRKFATIVHFEVFHSGTTTTATVIIDITAVRLLRRRTLRSIHTCHENNSKETKSKTSYNSNTRYVLPLPSGGTQCRLVQDANSSSPSLLLLAKPPHHLEVLERARRKRSGNNYF